LIEIKVGSFYISTPVRRAGCGGLFVNTSGGDGDGPRFCAPVPPSPPRFALITLDEFPSTSSFFIILFYPLFFVGTLLGSLSVY
jgi:hypothetical protein